MTTTLPASFDGVDDPGEFVAAHVRNVERRVHA